MRCKCGYITFDHLEICPKCNKDISKISEALSGVTFKAEIPDFLRLDVDESEEEVDYDAEVEEEADEETEIDFSGDDDSDEADDGLDIAVDDDDEEESGLDLSLDDDSSNDDDDGGLELSLDDDNDDGESGLDLDLSLDDDSSNDDDDAGLDLSLDDDNNDGESGYDDEVDTCYAYNSNDSSTFCNTEAYVNRVNAAGWCGASNWRMPTRKELEGIIKYNYLFFMINTDYFPNQASSLFLGYWSGSSYAANSDDAWYVDFFYGLSSARNRSVNDAVRLVRSGQ